MHACIAMIACPEEIEPDLPGFVVLAKANDNLIFGERSLILNIIKCLIPSGLL
jgi:hypothetical protein